MTEDAKPPDPDRTWPIRWIVLVYVLLLALNVWLLWFLPDAPASEKASFVLTLVGFYSLALNFSKDSGLVQSFPSWLEDMTSPSLRDFAAGSLRVLSVVFAMASLFVRGFPPPILSPLGILGALAALPLAFVVVAVTFVTGFAYLIVIVPLAYVAYLLASLVVDAVESAPGEVSLDSDEGHLAVKGAVRNHKAELKTLVVGVPATVLGIGTTAWSLFP